MRFGMAMIAGWVAFACTAPAGAACMVYSFATMPVSLSSDGVKTSALVNDHPVDLIIDSGLFYSVMHNDMAQSANIMTKPLSTGFSFYNSKGGMSATMGYADTLKFGKQTLSSPRFIVISGTHAPQIAMIGPNILNRQDVEYNVQGGSVRLSKPEGCTGKDMAYWAKADHVGAVPLEALEGEVNRVTIGKVLANGIPMRAMFSTRFPRTIVSSKAVRNLGSIYNEDGRDLIKLAKLDIGGEVQSDVALGVGADNLPNDVDMVLGLDFFLTHRIYVSNGRRTLFFTANDAPARAVTPNGQ